MLLGKTVAMSSFKILILAWVKFNDSAYALQKVRDQNKILHRFAMKFHAGLRRNPAHICSGILRSLGKILFAK